MLDYWKIDEKLVKRVASNAKLKLSEQEIERFTNQLSDILSAFKKIDEVDVTPITPSIHPIEIKNVLREDKFKPFIWKPLTQTKHREKKFFKSPRIV